MLSAGEEGPSSIINLSAGGCLEAFFCLVAFFSCWDGFFFVSLFFLAGGQGGVLSLELGTGSGVSVGSGLVSLGLGGNAASSFSSFLPS